MTLGQLAATAAALAIQHGTSIQDVDYADLITFYSVPCPLLELRKRSLHTASSSTIVPKLVELFQQ
ncbi:hypothetical protein Back11_57440 [Paenibacillus baekrokdamisoli]|uniref:Uncharacterized protein n=2 Tax=Paenibacillus baekrokdamisoli TaxID=1712516 RepID=A0A3G9JMY2_9BACL|nr:hypothetical protein [Paenibacillus baekrokdamisoli]BBH24399.1 hypothetical protein Back11_57440 [Paenibacillus baekrokdamisoli]